MSLYGEFANETHRFRIPRKSRWMTTGKVSWSIFKKPGPFFFINVWTGLPGTLPDFYRRYHIVKMIRGLTSVNFLNALRSVSSSTSSSILTVFQPWEISSRPDSAFHILRGLSQNESSDGLTIDESVATVRWYVFVLLFVWLHAWQYGRTIQFTYHMVH